MPCLVRPVCLINNPQGCSQQFVERAASKSRTNTEFYQAPSQVRQTATGERRPAGLLVGTAGHAVLSISSRMRFSASSLASGRRLTRRIFCRLFPPARERPAAVLSRELVPESIFVLHDANFAHAERKEFGRGKVALTKRVRGSILMRTGSLRSKPALAVKVVPNTSRFVL